MDRLIEAFEDLPRNASAADLLIEDRTPVYDDRVDKRFGCPKCGERRMDWLVWHDDKIECATCGNIYEIK